MTDRIKGLVVTLDRDYRSDDVENIVNAIISIKGVVDVSTSVTQVNDYMNRARVAATFRQKILDIFDEKNTII